MEKTITIDLIVPDTWPNDLLLNTVKSTLNVILFRNAGERFGIKKIELTSPKKTDETTCLGE